MVKHMKCSLATLRGQQSKFSRRVGTRNPWESKAGTEDAPPPRTKTAGSPHRNLDVYFLHANKLSIFPKISPWAKSEEKLKCVDRSFSIFESVPLNQNFAATPLDTSTSHKNCTPCHGLTVSLTYTLYTIGMKYSVPENNRNGLTDQWSAAASSGQAQRSNYRVPPSSANGTLGRQSSTPSPSEKRQEFLPKCWCTTA